MKDDLAKLLEVALEAVNVLSYEAKKTGDLPTMYKANQAWHALFEASNDLARRRLALTE